MAVIYEYLKALFPVNEACLSTLTPPLFNTINSPFIPDLIKISSSNKHSRNSYPLTVQTTKMPSADPPSSALDFTTFTHCINGTFLTTKTSRHGINPSNLSALPDVPVASEQDLDAAVTAARAAFKTWSKVPWEERKKALLAFNDALEEEKDDFVKLLTTEQGKPVSLVFLFLLCGVLGCRDEDEITVNTVY